MMSDSISLHRFNSDFDFVTAVNNLEDVPLHSSDERHLILYASLYDLIDSFRYFLVKDLKFICFRHKLTPAMNTRVEKLREILIQHVCQPKCIKCFYIFRERIKPRVNLEAKFVVSTYSYNLVPTILTPVTINANTVSDVERDSEIAEDIVPEYNEDHLDEADITLKNSIVQEWQEIMSNTNMQRKTCAVCAKRVLGSDSKWIDSTQVELDLLQNNELPEKAMPTNYNLVAYNRAILHHKGLMDVNTPGPMLICTYCEKKLLVEHTMPKFALANWLYYGHNSLPDDVKNAFANATSFDLALISRARANNICFRFRESDKPNKQDNDKNTVLNYARKGLRGNVMVTPLDVTRINYYLPPAPHIIADTICTVFIGKTEPSQSTIARLSPVLVRKSRVKKLINFLLDNNPHYSRVDGFKGYSEENLNKLFDTNSDIGVPCSMEIGHLTANDAIDSATADYTSRNEVHPDDTDIIMENVGYTMGDESPKSYQDMKMQALKHCLSGKKFLGSRSGGSGIPDFANPYMLSWLFPHLDPWGIGGFHNPARKKPLSMEQQLMHLLNVEGNIFQKDPEFAFIYYNLRQKKIVYQNIRFKVPQNQYQEIIADLMQIDTNKLTDLQENCKKNSNYIPKTEDEKKIMRLFARISTVGNNIPGSAAYKINLRNQIRGMINFKGTPSLFITLNPSDVDHPLVRLNAGDDIDIEDIARGEDMSKFQRSLLAAHNPHACAQFFDTIVRSFIHVILRYGRKGKGLFGECNGYFGTVETQGKGTLHIHFLIWLKGHLSPQSLRDKMMQSEIYQGKVFRWLESIIKCELLGTKKVVVEPNGKAMPPPNRSHTTGDPNPGTIPMPSIKRLSAVQFDQEYQEFVNALVKEYNWHIHKATCWKHLNRKQDRNDANCRMGIDGHTQAETVLDSNTSSILLRRLHPRIASFNDVVIFLIQSNMDIKFIGSGEAAKAYLYYLTDYITKPSLQLHAGLAALSHAIKRTSERFPEITRGELEQNSKSAMTITVNSMMGHQEISHQHVMSYLIGGGDHYTSETFQILRISTFIHWIIKATKNYVPLYSDHHGVENSSRDLRNDSQAPQTVDSQYPEQLVLSMGNKSITASSQLNDYIYRSNNTSYNKLCLYDFVRNVKKMLKKKNSETSTEQSTNYYISSGDFISINHPQFDTHTLKTRRKKVIPVLLGEKITNPDKSTEDMEVWARYILVLFKPWRNLYDILESDNTFTNAYNTYKPHISLFHMHIIHNMNVLSECRDARGALSRKWREERRQNVLNTSLDDAIQTLIDDEETYIQQADIHDNFNLDTQHSSNTDINTNVVDDVIGEEYSGLLDMCYSHSKISQPHSNNSHLYGQVREIEDGDRDLITEQANVMAILKKKRRPDFSNIESEPPRKKRRRSVNKPLVCVTSINKHQGDTEMHSDIPEIPKEYDDRWDIVNDVIDDMHLCTNDEQLRAFRIIARHILSGNDQLLMYIAGIGGAGKSHLIKAVIRLFEMLQRRSELLLGAFTGIAAVIINGYTMHALSMSSPQGKSKDIAKLAALWNGVNYLIIDEISMVSALFLSQFSARLNQAKGDDVLKQNRPFGGVNVIFTGDFAQLAPPRQLSLYSHQLVKNPSFQEGKNPEGVSAMHGAFLWRQVTTVVKLVKNQRHLADIEYAKVLDRIREGTSNSVCLTKGLTDLEFLSERELSIVAQRHTEDLKLFQDAPIIVGDKMVRDALNAKLVTHHAHRLSQDVHLYHAKDYIHRTAVKNNVREVLWRKATRHTKDSLGRLPLFPGMRVMVTENLAFSKGVVNGVEGTVQDIKYSTDEQGRRYAEVVYVHLLNSGVISTDMDLDEDIVPILPERVNFEASFEVNGKIETHNITRYQLPLLPAYSYTDFKSQGRTLEYAIVDITTARGQGVYVMLSRVKTAKGIIIMRHFPATKILRRLSEDIRDELQRIDMLDATTLMAYTQYSATIPVRE